MKENEDKELAGQPSGIESHQSLSEYHATLARLDDLRPLAQLIAARVRPGYHEYGVEDFDVDSVTVTCYWRNYDSDPLIFPSAWLFALDWKRLVDEHLAEEAREKEEIKQRETQAIEEREREQLAGN